MNASTARLAAWGVLIGLLAIGVAFIVLNGFSQEGVHLQDIVSRNVKVSVTPETLRTGATTSVQVAARDGEGGAVAAWEGARLDAWLVRNDLTYAAHVRADNDGATSSFATLLRPTQPGGYKLVASGVREHVVTIGAAPLSVTGPAEDVPPEEQSAGREGYKVVMSTVPDTDALRPGVPVSVTFTISRTGAPVVLDAEAGFRGSLVAFRENGTLFVRGEPSSSALLPSPASAAFTLVFPEPGRYRLFFEFGAQGRSFMEARWIEVVAAQ